MKSAVAVLALAGAAVVQASEPGIPSPGTLREAQQQLASHGHDAGPTDGKWGRRTETAVKDFQQKNGLERSGKLDDRTLTALGVIGQDLSASTGASAPAASVPPIPNYLKPID